MITRKEEMLLLIVLKLEADASGARIRKAVEALTGKQPSIGGIYMPLDRLVRKGLLTARDKAPTKERGGRRKRMYEVSQKGMVALAEARAMEEAMWSGLPGPVSARLGLV